MKKLQNRSEGFTIIEVLIVLAIAGLIMLIVFLAVPALQRNSRNTQRNSDASLIASGVNECLNNRNGQISSCNDASDGDNLGAFIDESRLSQLTAVRTPSGAATAPGSDGTITNEANIFFGARCAPDGAGPDGGGGLARDYVVLFRIEGSNGSLTRCISSG
ncbi:MAG TPA: type II secretion system protein [Candidatus Saccharimonadales bacterium]|nr:type II secretion system protein [Candidatus Saccharimonadales bacterium]